mmetsp:Transcript_12791/g.11340  ORF Transcript_12791/g.11340 Transcript_12791/m.11340 type:complete len:163 (-) Transcript_12791:662-1150(-)
MSAKKLNKFRKSSAKRLRFSNGSSPYKNNHPIDYMIKKINSKRQSSSQLRNLLRTSTTKSNESKTKNSKLKLQEKIKKLEEELKDAQEEINLLKKQNKILKEERKEKDQAFKVIFELDKNMNIINEKILENLPISNEESKNAEEQSLIYLDRKLLCNQEERK